MASSEANAAPAAKRHKLVGCKNFVRNNPKSDRFTMRKFHHIEFWCAAAAATTTTATRAFFLSFRHVIARPSTAVVIPVVPRHRSSHV